MFSYVYRLSRRTSGIKTTPFETHLCDVGTAAVRSTGVRFQLHDAHAVRVGRTEKSACCHRGPEPTVDQHSDRCQGSQLGRAKGWTDKPVSNNHVYLIQVLVLVMSSNDQL